MATTPKKYSDYLRQAGSGHIYAWTPQLARRPDMIPYDDNAAKVQVEALKKRIAKLKALEAAGRLESGTVTDKVMADASLNSAALARLEGEVATLEDMHRIRSEAARKAKEAEEKGEAPPPDPTANMTTEEKEAARIKGLVDNDPEIQKIRAMRSKQEVADYMAENYGEVRDPETGKFDALKDEALALREARIIELDNLS